VDRVIEASRLVTLVKDVSKVLEDLGMSPMTPAMTPGIRCWEPSAAVISVPGAHPRKAFFLFYS
jgi:hypothetical protein